MRTLGTGSQASPYYHSKKNSWIDSYFRCYLPVSSPTISGAYSWAICRTSATLRTASGLGSTTMRTPGIPREFALAWAALVKALVMTLTEGTPLDSVITVSWRPHAVQEPQSAIAWTTTSHCSANESSVSVAQAEL